MKLSQICAYAALVISPLCTTTASVAQGRGPQTDPGKERREAEAEAKENEGRLRGSELARELPGLEMSEGLPSLLLFPAIQVHFPYQLIGLGATIELVPAPWLRVSALYSVGVTPQKGSVVWSNYAEALLGVSVFGATGESAVDVPLKRRGAGLFPEVPVVKAWVPSHHALFVEAGGLTGLTSLQECTENCDPDDFSEPPPEATQLVVPLGGLRYVYGFDLKSKRQHARARLLLQAYAHVLGPPLNAPESPRYFPNGTPAGDPGVGGRVGISTSPFGACIAEVLFGFGCMDGGLALGYAPYPRVILFELQLGGFVY